MRKKINYIIWVLVFTMPSCEDFLNNSPTGTMTGGSALSSPEAALAFTNSIYDNTTVFNSQASSWGGNTILLLEYMTDKATSENSQSNFKDFGELTVSARSYYIEQWWQGCYAGIAKCNLALQKLPGFEATVSGGDLSKYEGEIRFMRALYYFYLVRIFGDVPKIIVPLTNLAELQVSRAPTKEIYDEIIIPDLLLAEKSNLPLKDETGRASLNAVKTLLADVYLTYAGFPIQGGKEFYRESAKRSLEVINTNSYTLFPTYEGLRLPANNNKGEFIFQVQFSVNRRSNEAVPLVLPSRSGMSAFQLEYGSLIPTDEFVKSYPSGDKRTEEKQFYFRTYKGHPSKFSAGAPELALMDFNAYYINKFFDKNAIDVAGQSGLNWTIYRYADLLLLYAEAQVEADGAPDLQAFEALNAIRKRANLLPFTSTDARAFKHAVWDERYFELSYENKTWFDMLRTRLIRDDGTGNYVDFIGYKNNLNKVYTAKQLLFPIPLRELQANSNLTQNEGY